MCIWEDQQSRLDKDTKATLELTREMTSWPKSPPKEFKTDLKADLAHQVVKQQKKDIVKRGDPEYRNFLRRPAWQFTFTGSGALIVAAIIFLIVYLLNH